MFGCVFSFFLRFGFGVRVRGLGFGVSGLESTVSCPRLLVRLFYGNPGVYVSIPDWMRDMHAHDESSTETQKTH